MSIKIKLATSGDIEALVKLAGQYHEYESIASTPMQRQIAIEPLLKENAQTGFVLLAISSGKYVGYVAICYGYSIELGGRDAFVDELFVVEDERSKGIGRLLIETAKEYAKTNNVRFLHLEVANDNEEARQFYQALDFSPRSRFHLMSCKL